MKFYRKKILILAMAMILCGVCVLPWPRAAYAAPSAEPTKSTIADKLILQLGPDWAGVEFELVTDVGKYPGTIVVSEAGVLTLELSDSSTFILSCLNSQTAPPVPALQEPEEQTAAPVDPSGHFADSAQSGDPLTAHAHEAEQPSDDTTAQTPKPAEPADESQQGIPTLQLVLFIGGTVLCVGGLIIMYAMKKHREYDDDADE